MTNEQGRSKYTTAWAGRGAFIDRLIARCTHPHSATVLFLLFFVSFWVPFVAFFFSLRVGGRSAHSRFWWSRQRFQTHLETPAHPVHDASGVGGAAFGVCGGVGAPSPKKESARRSSVRLLGQRRRHCVANGERPTFPKSRLPAGEGGLITASMMPVAHRGDRGTLTGRGRDHDHPVGVGVAPPLLLREPKSAADIAATSIQGGERKTHSKTRTQGGRLCLRVRRNAKRAVRCLFQVEGGRGRHTLLMPGGGFLVTPTTRRSELHTHTLMALDATDISSPGSLFEAQTTRHGSRFDATGASHLLPPDQFGGRSRFCVSPCGC